MTTKHNHLVVFGRIQDGCPRCDELKAGAPAIKGWGAMKRAQERQQLEDIRHHNCRTAGCGPVCTFGDW